ncbi:MAG: N,N-dimethylformamidase beta subunit family domain-containing protein, partial [Solirubrobacterales bacterium]
MLQQVAKLYACTFALFLALLAGQGLLAETAAAGACDPPANEIVCENSKPGAPEGEWDVEGAGDPSIQGFATEISVDRGQTVHFKIKTSSTKYRLDIYRMGYYGGDGARKVDTVLPSATLPQAQPACDAEPTTGLIDCGNWSESASWPVPATAVSGIYFAKLVREDQPSEGSHIVFVVRDDGGHSDLLFQTSDTTWEAYNQYGGNSLYEGGPGTNPGRAYKVSYNRPLETRGPTPEDDPFNAEYPMVRWLERNGYDVSYFTGVDADRSGSEIPDHKVYLSVGHDEYWSGQQRANVEAARDAGVDLAFFSGNEIFWKTRWEDSIDGSGADYRTLVSYKETHANAKIDPEANVWTGTWQDPRFSPPADGGRPQNALSGTLFAANSGATAIQVPAADAKLRFWRNTSLTSLEAGQTATLAEETLGYEWDEDADNGFRPAGLADLSSTTVTVPERLLDYGSNYGPGTVTHHLTLYRAPSGALVFGAGTVQWSWGLDPHHDRGGSSTADPRMQQATVNLLADMGTQPETLQEDLVPAAQTTDTTPPQTTIGSPVAGGKVERGKTVTVEGTATDAEGETGGGEVGGVEVSTDGGSTWRPASGRDHWSYSWTPQALGQVTVMASAVDDSGNLESPGDQVEVEVTEASCPCSIWEEALSGPEDPDP